MSAKLLILPADFVAGLFDDRDLLVFVVCHGCVCVGLVGKGDGTKLAECLHAIADFSGQVAKVCVFPTLLACLAAAFEDVFDLKAECCGGGDICVVAHVCVLVGVCCVWLTIKKVG